MTNKVTTLGIAAKANVVFEEKNTAAN